MIEVTSLTKVYGTGDGAVTAVDDVSLSVPSGQVFGILGRSGAGKTTLMRCLTALERPTSGSVTIGEVNLTELSASGLRKARHRMGMIFQHFNLLNSRTAADNIAFPLEVQGVPAAERTARVTELLDVPAALAVCALDPVGSVLAASRIVEAPRLSQSGGQVWGFPAQGPLLAICWAGANLVPVVPVGGAEHAQALDAFAARAGRRTRS